MMADQYTKTTLTIIAAALVAIVIQNFTAKANAGPGACGAPGNPCYVTASPKDPMYVQADPKVGLYVTTFPLQPLEVRIVH